MAAQGDDSSAEIRVRLLELFEIDEWKFSQRARREGKVALHWLYRREPTDGEMIHYVVELLRSRVALKCAPQGDPPGSTGIAWQMIDPRKNVFVKLRIEGGFGEQSAVEYAYIQSLHVSDF